jgi:hypothetical protein
MKAGIAVIAGDGIGPEVVAEGVRVLERVAAKFGHDFAMQAAPFGGAAIDLRGDPLPKETLDACLAADAVLLGAIGGPKWGPAAKVRPEQGLLRIRRELGLYANLRPIKLHPALRDTSTLKPKSSTAWTWCSCASSPAESTSAKRPARHAGHRPVQLFHRRDRAHHAGRRAPRECARQESGFGRQGQRARDLAPVA